MKGGTIEEILVKICGGEEGGREGGGMLTKLAIQST